MIKKFASLLFPLLLLTSCGNSQQATVISADVYTFDCETSAQRPESIMIYCADGGAYVEKILWDSWGADGATGSGEYTYNDCDPDCADGSMHSVEVKVVLSDPITFQKKKYLSKLNIETLDGGPLSDSLGNSFEWDVSEFAVMMSQE